MGAHHVSYRENFDALLSALEQIQRKNSRVPISLTWRRGGLRFEHPSVRTGVRGFAPDYGVARQSG
jgi:hypothetical protein